LHSRTLKAFSPAGISSFFEICDTTPDGKPIPDLERVGSRGGGFAIERGVLTEVTTTPVQKAGIQIFINRKLAPEAETSRTVVEMLLEKVDSPYDVVVKHKVDVPIGAGFGTSAGGALTTALALARLLRIDLTMIQIAKIAHVAEVMCRTGLGTVGPLTLGGCVLTIEPGALGYSLLDRLLVHPSHRIVAAHHKPILTRQVLTSSDKRERVNRWGRQTLSKILEDPSLENFMNACKEFAIRTGFASEMVLRLFKVAERADAIGVAQNMVGEAVHALTTVDDAERVAQSLSEVLPQGKVFAARIDLRGARLVGC